MKLHQGRQRNNRFGGQTYSTLCGRMNAQSKDGMNIADTPAEVTCAFCRKDFRFAALLAAADTTERPDPLREESK